MKLLKKVILYFIVSSVFIFILGSVSAYFVLKTLIAEEVDETLISEKNRIVKQLEQSAESIPNWKTIHLEVRQIKGNFAEKETLSDTLIYTKDTGEFIPLRQLHFYTRIKDKNYRITLRRSLIEKEDLVAGVTGLMIGIFIATILLLNLINYRSERKLWKPFYKTLQSLNAFELDSQKALNLPSVNILEFEQLNKTLNALTEKLRRDYRNLKQFSENAAHEMQTPLAILRSKLDIMIQDQSFSDEQLQNIRSLYNALNRLSRLNQSLNLLIRIENQEFNRKRKVDFSELIKQQLENLSELIQIQRLSVTTDLDADFVTDFNPFMAETLISNLLINAIKHNVPEGRIDIELNARRLRISNSGQKPKVNPDILFERFKKANPSSDSPGLGLSIVRQICLQNGIDINYAYVNARHTITLYF
ncbi:MAG: HAMP domain-containing histidine kinase [Calditrichaeota bacterium]|nr:HAMP domain-containing histidine kinase [Calditrichota bacterium]